MQLKSWIFWQLLWLPVILGAGRAIAQNDPNPIDINPEILRSSPVLQRWLKKIPDISADIQNDPSFRTKFRVVYSQYPSKNQLGGWGAGISDLILGGSSLVFNVDYQNQGQFNSYGADANYYVLPLGGYFNISPVLGYRHIETAKYDREGLQVGVKVILVPSRGGGGDIALQQTWIKIGSNEEVGIGSLTAGYALTNQLRVTGDIQFQNTRESKDSRVGIGLEWMPW